MLQANREEPSPTLAEIFKLEREEGLKEGEEKGRKEAQQNFAKRLLSTNNMSVKEIVELTELTADEVEKLKKDS